MNARLGYEFGIAFCKHFNMPPNRVSNLKVNTGQDEILSATVDIMLTPEDLSAIAALMDAPKQPE